MRQYPSVHIPKLAPITKFLLITYIAFFICTSIVGSLGHDPIDLFGLTLANIVEKYRFYTFVTSFFLSFGFFEVLFDAIILYFVSCELEHIYGQRRYLNFLIFLTFLSLLVYLLFSLSFFQGHLIPFTGIGLVCSASLILYASHFPDRYFSFMFFFPIKAKYFCYILVGIQLYLAFFSASSLGAITVLASMLSAYLWILKERRPSFFSFKQKKKAHLRIVKSFKHEEEKNGPYWH